MRLICPNCAAQYEVPDDVIPAEGRDVQCSNCAQTWFQAAANSPDEEDAADSSLDEAFADPEDPADPETDNVAPAETAPRQRRLDPAVADILREEAELETRLRAQESSAFESQSEFALEEQPAAPAPPETEETRRAREAQQRMRRLRGLPDEDDDAPDEARDQDEPARGGRGAALFPDIEEINSSLRSTSDRESDDVAALTEQLEMAQAGKSFRYGFGVTVGTVAMAVLIYANAPAISSSLPVLAPTLDGYVTLVNDMRVGLDQWVQGALVRLDAMNAEAGAN